MSYHNLPSSTNLRTTNDQGQVAPPGYHYMPDGSLMLDSEMTNTTLNGGPSLPRLTNLDLDLSDLPAIKEVRRFVISGDKGAEFRLEIKDKDTGKYYNFVTNLFQTTASSLEEEILGRSYSGAITFPAITGSTDQYDIFLYAKPGTEHAVYREVRFSDGSLDINNSTGSNSLMMQKVIYQYAALTLTLQGYSIDGTVAGAMAADTISINRGKPQVKTAFSFTATAGATAAYRILKQPTSNDVLAFIQPVVGSAPIDLPGENIYPAVTAANKVVDGAVTSGDVVTMDDDFTGLWAVGDKITGNAALDARTQYNAVTVKSINPSNAKEFQMSEAIAIDDDETLSFSNRMNYSWPITKAHLVKQGMITVGLEGTSVSSYEDSITLLAGTKNEKKIIKNKRPALSTFGKKPTVVKGLVTAQDGNVVFDTQQLLALAGDTLKIGGYGESEILRVYGWDVKFTDLAITLTAPTTTTSGAVSASRTIGVADTEGVINNVSRISGIGINPALQNPLITAGGGTDGAGNWTADAVQTLESGITLTVENTGRVATITGNIEIVKAGTASQTLRFDINQLLSTSA